MVSVENFVNKIFKPQPSAAEMAVSGYLQQARDGKIPEFKIGDRREYIFDRYGKYGARIRVFWGFNETQDGCTEKSYFIKYQGHQVVPIFEGFIKTDSKDWQWLNDPSYQEYMEQ